MATPSSETAPDAGSTHPVLSGATGGAPPPRAVEIRVEDLSCAFGSHVVLDRITFEIYQGEIVAIVGGSGSGKTILLDHATGLMAPQSGRVLVADHDAPLEGDGTPLVDLAQVTPEKLDAIRMHWAIVFQHNALFGGTVFDNIALWFREHTSQSQAEIERRVRDSLIAVSLDPEEVMTKERAALSGGMAKRVAVARALATDPIVIFYDEPTTGLDPIVGAHIHELIWNTHNHSPGRGAADGGSRSPRARRTSVIVTHDRELLRRLRPRVIMLAETKVVFDGSYDEFTRTDNPQAQLYLRAMPVLHARPSESGGPRTRHEES